MTAPTDTPHWSAALDAIGAGPVVAAWARTQPDLLTAWQHCERGDRMLWLAGRLSGRPGSEARRPLVRATCACVRFALRAWEQQYPDDRSPRALLDMGEAWARGDAHVTLDDVRAAADDALAHKDAIWAAVATAITTAYATTATIAAAAAYAAAADVDAWAVTWDAARRATLAECADIVRRFYPTPPMAEEGQEIEAD